MQKYRVRLLFDDTLEVEAESQDDARRIVEILVFDDENNAFDPQVESIAKEQ
jgi:hypothetical protein